MISIRFDIVWVLFFFVCDKTIKHLHPWICPLLRAPESGLDHWGIREAGTYSFGSVSVTFALEAVLFSFEMGIRTDCPAVVSREPQSRTLHTILGE